jgi:glycosyltransferase involved in cell wall biosynthesis
MKEIKYSIIIPHKNSFDLLCKLIKSIPKCNSYQVIVIDDNSTLHEKEKLRNNTFNDNVKIIYNSNSEGAGKARNIGLKEAKGKWMLFADADDFFSDNIENLLENYFESNYDIIYFGTTSYYIDTSKTAYRHERYMNLINDNSKEDALKYFYTPPWSKMIRTEVVNKNNIRFEEIIASNDIYFSLKLAYHANAISVSDKILYIITVSPGSLTNSFSYRHFDAKFNAALRANKFLCSINKKRYQQSILYFLAKSYNFGIMYSLTVIYKLIKNRSNIFIGMEKSFSYKKVLNQRENRKYLVKKD